MIMGSPLPRCDRSGRCGRRDGSLPDTFVVVVATTTLLCRGCHNDDIWGAGGQAGKGRGPSGRGDGAEDAVLAVLPEGADLGEPGRAQRRDVLDQQHRLRAVVVLA